MPSVSERKATYFSFSAFTMDRKCDSDRPSRSGNPDCDTRFAVENGQKTIWGSCANVIFIRNAGTNPKVMAVRSKANVNRKNLIMSADSCFEFLRDLEKEHDPDLVRRRAAEFAEDVRHYSRLIELT